MTFGERLTGAMKDAKITQGKLERDAGLSRGHASRLCKAKSGDDLAAETVNKIASVVGRSTSWLLRGEESASAPRTVVVTDDRYPTRPNALAALRAQGVPEDLIGIVASLGAHSDEDPGIRYWMIDAVREARTIQAESRKAATEADPMFTTPAIGAKKKGRK